MVTTRGPLATLRRRPGFSDCGVPLASIPPDLAPAGRHAEQLIGPTRPSVRTISFQSRVSCLVHDNCGWITGMPLQDIAQAEGFVFVALVTLTVIAILDLFLPRGG